MHCMMTLPIQETILTDTEFNPGDASDPDFCLKLWNKNVRIFKALSQFKVYHFGSVTIRKNKSIIQNLIN